MAANSEKIRNAEFGSTIQAAREAIHVPRSKLALASEISYSFLSAIERGEKNPKPDTMNRLYESLQQLGSDIPIPPLTEPVDEERIISGIWGKAAMSTGTTGDIVFQIRGNTLRTAVRTTRPAETEIGEPQ
jgi:transcriptional regulator with XRE-family HTH domain